MLTASKGLEPCYSIFPSARLNRRLGNFIMSSSHYSFKTALVTGGGGGIGKALSQQLIKDGKKVIIAGRTESKLQDSAKEIGASAYYVLDTGDVSSIAGFVKKITNEHPDLDCLVNNAGVQRPLDVNDMATTEFLEKADQEININIRGPMHLALQLLPHLKSKVQCTDCQRVIGAGLRALLHHQPRLQRHKSMGALLEHQLAGAAEGLECQGG